MQHFEQAAEDAYERLLNPSIQTEVRLELKDRSDEEAIKVFRENLENLLLAPPAGMLSVLASIPASAPAARSPWWTTPASSWSTP